jgi:tripartite-type tricarboxylate transporter receptor subunit TctC
VGWRGFVAPAATPLEITTKLRNAYLAVIRDADITKKLTDAGIDVLQSAAAEFADYLRTETANWAAVIRAANIHAD